MLRFARVDHDFLETPVRLDPAEIATLPADVVPAPRRGIDNARFIPGDIVAGRYRIVGLLGRGGMGEVYRADDLKLGQPVALKFLAESLSAHGAALARFHREVSLARQITHRHVCRVYDIGEHAGMHFLSMEYVRGEELSSLLKRIGRLPLDKALQTARQLCAGLAAIHAAGVLHRDLKPANVMIDEHGDVRIADFGVAALSEGVSGREAMIGTPAYMAPEQLAGGELTTRSDIYALGLVLYEAFTGNRPFAATTPPEIVRVRLGDTSPVTPSSWVTDLDPLVERVILRCLEKDPAHRPSSALQVAASLPGGDPLAAALAAGETPSPQMVAASAKAGILRPRVAVLLLLAIFAGIVVGAFLAEKTSLVHFVPLPLSPELLNARAETYTDAAGYTTPPADTASGFSIDYAVVNYVMKHDRAADKWERFRQAPLPTIYFWHRRSPAPLVPADYWSISAGDPPARYSGMVTMRLDTTGRLFSFEAVPPQEETAAEARTRTDWPRFFERAGLKIDDFRPATPRWTPPQHSDERLSWTGVHPARPGLPLRIEAASYRGLPVWFEVIPPWRKAEREVGTLPSAGEDTFGIVLMVFYFGAMTLAALLAWKNVRMGRGDRRGAFRLALFIFFNRMLFWLFMAHHVAAVDEVGLLVAGLQSAVYWAALLALLYLALEPFVRRRWPEGLISWSRLLAGDVRNPLVGRDILIGGALGMASILANHLILILPPLLGRPIARPALHSPLLFSQGLDGARGAVLLLLTQTVGALMFALILLTVVLFLALLTRRNRLAFALSWLIFYFALNLNFGDGTPLGYLTGLLFPTILMFALIRYGLLTLVSIFFYNHLWGFFPATTDLAAWYATPYLIELAVLGAITIYAFRVSLAGQKVVNASILDE
ncbi:MAG TPA: serine/threonine-protein kinase [Thermoanaerobaculia bacterium]|nr:serine/threonine-protein kinase [Thermoanaerobaculia bacterium]